MTYAVMLKVLCHGFHPSSIESFERIHKENENETKRRKNNDPK